MIPSFIKKLIKVYLYDSLRNTKMNRYKLMKRARVSQKNREFHKLLSWTKKYILIFCTLYIVLVIIMAISFFPSIEDPKKVNISIPENISDAEKKLKTVYVVDKEKHYNIINGATLSLDLAKEAFGLASNALLSHLPPADTIKELFDIAKEALSQTSINQIEYFNIPVNAWCNSPYPGLYEYKWVETNKNYFNATLNTTLHWVIIADSFAFYTTGTDVTVYRIQQ